MGLLIHDPMHPEGEEQFVLIGMSAERRILAVVNVERRERLRIIERGSGAGEEGV
jgi:uncharacterized DUF497 family protein